MGVITIEIGVIVNWLIFCVENTKLCLMSRQDGDPGKPVPIAPV